MNAIILAAGQGTRLRPLTNDRPKVMVDLAGVTILDRQCARFTANGISDITVVTGYCRDSVRSSFSIETVTNPLYDQTNMAYSLSCAADRLKNGTVISYGDIIYDEAVLKALLHAPYDISVAVDLEWEPYYLERSDQPYEDAESMIFDGDGRISSIGKSNPEPSEVQAQYIGLIKVTAAGAEQIRDLYRDIRGSAKPIGWGRPFERAFMTDVLQELINRGVPVHAVPVRRGWFEIDSLEDYRIAGRGFEGLQT